MYRIVATVGIVLFSLGLQAAEPQPTQSRFDSHPEPWPASMLASVREHTYVPPAALGKHRLGEAAVQQRLLLRPTADLKGLAWESAKSRLGVYLAPATAPAFDLSPDAQRLAAPWRPSDPDRVGADTTSDPGLDQSRRATVAAIRDRSLLPPPAAGQAPRRADAGQQQALAPRPATDLPGVAWESGLRLASPFLPPVRALAYRPALDAARLAAPWRETSPDADRPSAVSDPVPEQVREVTLAAVPPLRHRSAPLLVLPIPDPFELSAAVRLRTYPPDNDPAVASFAPRPKPLLPVQPPPPKP